MNGIEYPKGPIDTRPDKVEAIPPGEYDKSTDLVQYEGPLGYDPDTDSVVYTGPEDYSTDTAGVKYVDPNGYDALDNPVMYDPAQGYVGDTDKVHYDPNPEFTPNTSQAKYDEGDGFDPTTLPINTEPIDEYVGVTRSAQYTPATYERPGGREIVTPPSKPIEIIPPEFTKGGTKEKEDKKKGKVRAEWTPATKADLENLNIHDYIFETPSIVQVLETIKSKLGMSDLDKVRTNITSAKSLINKIKSRKSVSTWDAVLLSTDLSTPKKVQSEALVPVVNQWIDRIPILGAFTKKSYSLDHNKITYADEASGNWYDDLLGISKSGVCGLYYNARFYHNHNTPLSGKYNVEYVIKRMSGDPSASAPDKAIIRQARELNVPATVNGERMTINPLTDYRSIENGVGTGLSSFKNIFTRKRYNIDPEKKAYSPDDYSVTTADQTLNLESQMGDTEYRGPFKGNSFGVSGKMWNPSPLKESTFNKNWVQALVHNNKNSERVSEVFAPPYYRPAGNFDELAEVVPIKSLSEYIDYQETIRTQILKDSEIEVAEDDTSNIYYGRLPYNWFQVFDEFEVGSEGNWNLALSRFTGANASLSKFVPDGMPTYGKWRYMPILNFDYSDKQLAGISIDAGNSFNVQIPAFQQNTSVLSISFMDDRYSRIYNWFSAYVNQIAGFWEGYAYPYKNCCLKAVLDLLDWDRTILKRVKLAIVPVQFVQSHTGDQTATPGKIVNVTFSVVAEVYDEQTAKSGNRPQLQNPQNLASILPHIKKT